MHFDGLSFAAELPAAAQAHVVVQLADEQHADEQHADVHAVALQAEKESLVAWKTFAGLLGHGAVRHVWAKTPCCSSSFILNFRSNNSLKKMTAAITPTITV